jgi:hypothetical protein
MNATILATIIVLVDVRGRSRSMPTERMRSRLPAERAAVAANAGHAGCAAEVGHRRTRECEAASDRLRYVLHRSGRRRSQPRGGISRTRTRQELTIEPKRFRGRVRGTQCLQGAESAASIMRCVPDDRRSLTTLRISNGAQRISHVAATPPCLTPRNSGARDRNRCLVVRGQRDEDVPNVGVIGEHFRQFASQYFGEMPVGRVVSATALSQLFFHSRHGA